MAVTYAHGRKHTLGVFPLYVDVAYYAEHLRGFLLRWGCALMRRGPAGWAVQTGCTVNDDGVCSACPEVQLQPVRLRLGPLGPLPAPVASSFLISISRLVVFSSALAG